MRIFYACALSFFVATQSAPADETRACLEARDRACLLGRVAPETEAALSEGASRGITEGAMEFAVNRQQDDTLRRMLASVHPQAATSGDTELTGRLIYAFSQLDDPEALESFAEGLPGANIHLPEAMAAIGYRFALDGNTAGLAVTDSFARRDDTTFVLIDRAAREGRWNEAFDWSGFASVDAKLAASQRVAWYAALSGDEAVMERAAGALLALVHPDTAPVRERPDLGDRIAAWLDLTLAGDPDYLAAVAEEDFAPEIDADLTLVAFQELIAAMLLARAGAPARAEPLIESSLGALEDEMRSWDAEMDGELIALSVAAHELGQEALRDRLFALRAVGPFSFHNHLLSFLDGDTLGHFLPRFETQFLEMADGALSGRTGPEYFEHAVREGFLTEIGPICAAYIRQKRPDAAARLHGAAQVLFARVADSPYAKHLEKPDKWLAHLYRDCHPAAGEDPAFEASFVDAPDEYAFLDYLIETREWTRIVPALRAQHDIALDHTLGRLEGIAIGAMPDEALDAIFQLGGEVAADRRTPYPLQADDALALLVQYATLMGRDDAGSYFARIEAPEMRLRAVAGAIWALGEAPPERLPYLQDSYVWYGTRVNVVPGL